MAEQSPTKSATHKIGEFGLVPKFLGYRAREDNTTLPVGTLISPSRNVVTNTSGRIAHVRGYELDGSAASTLGLSSDSGILSNFDFINFKGDERNLRCGLMTVAGNDGKLQYRYQTSDGVVHWVDLKTGLSNVRLSYTDYWDNTNLVKDVLWVDGTDYVYNWNGAVTTFASATATTLTKEGTNTWAQEGFAQTGTRSVVINGVAATYTGGENTTTLTGLSVDFSASTVGDIIHQEVVTVALSAMTSILATFEPTVIGCGRRNQVYLGSSKSNNLYISKVNDYTNYAFTSPTRVVGEGALIPLDAPPVKFIAQENRTDALSMDMYISEGLSTWAIIRATLSSDLTKEQLEHIRLKTGPLLGAQSERLCSKMKNEIIYIGNDNVANFMGYHSYQYVPSIVDFSFSIVEDMNSYDMTDGSIYYHKNYVFLSVPLHGIVRIYNMTDQSNQYTSFSREEEDVTKQPWYWEAPVTYPVSGFYVVDGELYGHSFVASESYKLFSSGSFNGQDIETNATFSYDDKGDRTQSKGSDEIWVEGYIKQNTVLNVTVSGDLDAFVTSQTKQIDGSDASIVALGGGSGGLGKVPLGSQSLGGSDTQTDDLPAWFHVAKTYNQVPFYLESVSFESRGVDLNYELLTFGTNARYTPEGNNSITQ